MKSFFILALFLVPALAFCQSSKGGLKVFIENAEEDDIIGATVQVMDGERQVTGGVTDFSGFLYLPNIESGTYVLRIKHIIFGEREFFIRVRTNSIYEFREKLKMTMADYVCFFRNPILEDPFTTVFEAADILTCPNIYRN